MSLVDLSKKWLVWLTLAAAPAALGQEGAAFFEKEVRPLLAKNCYACHSESGNVAMGGLRLDSLEGVMAGGGRGSAIVSGKPAESLLIRAIGHGDEKLSMPPTGKLTDAEIATLTRWGRAGSALGSGGARGGRRGAGGVTHLLVICCTGRARDAASREHRMGAVAD